MIDAGISYRQMVERLKLIGVSIEEISAVLITHDHIDHIQGLPLLTAKQGSAVFANRDTAKGIVESLRIVPKFKIFSSGEPFVYEDLKISPFTVQHDTMDPVGFTIEVEGKKIGICTDLGFATSLVKASLQQCDYLYVEANHQPSMVHASSRPSTYKQRVLSRQGHLSNEDCALLLQHLHHNDLKHVYLAHLSSECNAEPVALEIVSRGLQSAGYLGELSIAYQDRVSKPLFF